MKFKNPNKTRRVKDGISWKTVHKNDIIDLPERVGLAYDLIPIEEPKKKTQSLKSSSDGSKNSPSNFKESISQEPKSDFKEELKQIDGIGDSRAKDVILAYPTKEELKRDIHEGKELPFRDDIDEKLRKAYR